MILLLKSNAFLAYKFLFAYRKFSNTKVTALGKALTGHWEATIKGLDFRAVFMKFQDPVNIRKFLVFFINYQVQFISQKRSVVRYNVIISFMYWNKSFICTSVIMIKAQFFPENKCIKSLTNKCNVPISFIYWVDYKLIVNIIQSI